MVPWCCLTPGLTGCQALRLKDYQFTSANSWKGQEWVWLEGRASSPQRRKSTGESILINQSHLIFYTSVHTKVWKGEKAICDQQGIWDFMEDPPLRTEAATTRNVVSAVYVWLVSEHLWSITKWDPRPGVLLRLLAMFAPCCSRLCWWHHLHPQKIPSCPDTKHLMYRLWLNRRQYNWFLNCNIA